MNFETGIKEIDGKYNSGVDPANLIANIDAIRKVESLSRENVNRVLSQMPELVRKIRVCNNLCLNIDDELSSIDGLVRGGTIDITNLTEQELMAVLQMRLRDIHSRLRYTNLKNEKYNF